MGVYTGTWLGANQKEVADKLANISADGSSLTADAVALEATDGDFDITTSATLSLNASSIIMLTLPTSDPGTLGEIWSNSGVLTVSAG